MDESDDFLTTGLHGVAGVVVARIDALLAASGRDDTADRPASPLRAGGETDPASRAGPTERGSIVLALAGGHAAAVDALRSLLTSKRDTDEIPDFAELDDRRAALVARLAAIPARTFDELSAKARVVVMRAALIGNDGADPLARSLAEDIVALAEAGA